MLCGVLVLGYFLYKVVELRKKKRNRKTKLRPNRIGQFLDNLPPPGQTAPLKNDLLHEMPDQSANNVEQIVGDTHLRVPCSIEHSLTRAECRLLHSA
ncbi:hypothetical protein T4E_2826 [Trichinella pseudospiralis]|uniref:Uncharacterized protein n=1 Tax=Trichinella pseudospiralis TaxID=6337 RepID=A0A0V0Y1C5_TRIPS|nr:hypothetical protein T4E_2826 [Trichinella pseudospiralis]